MSDSLQPHGLQHARPHCPSPTPRVYSNSCPSSQWCHPTISSSVLSFSPHLWSFPASGSFPMSWFFASGGQSIGALQYTSCLKIEACFTSPLAPLNKSRWASHMAQPSWKPLPFSSHPQSLKGLSPLVLGIWVRVMQGSFPYCKPASLFCPWEFCRQEY